MSASSARNKVTSANRQAKDDTFTTNLMAEVGAWRELSVMDNDGGGNVKSLLSAGQLKDGIYTSTLRATLTVVDGVVRYVLTDAAVNFVQGYTKGTPVEDSFTYQIHLGKDTFSTATAKLYIEAVNHVADIKGTTTGTVTEDGQLSATGTLIVTDRDVNDGSFDLASTNNQTGTYGTFSLEQSGVWTYELNNAAADVQALTAATDGGASETFNVYSLDGTSKAVTVTIHGAEERVPLTQDHFGFERDIGRWSFAAGTFILKD